MYTPASFAETDPAALGQFMAEHAFALLVSQRNSGLVASHLPLLVEWSAEQPSALVGHLARANSQWKELAGQEVLAIFSGPHAYISPRWYAERNTVPTWNYTAVHAYGVFHILDDAETCRVLERSVQEFEDGLPAPWSMEENDAELLEKLRPQIVGFRIQITRLEGKLKLNQNHSVERRKRVIEQLQAQPTPNRTAIAELMEQSLQRDQ